MTNEQLKNVANLEKKNLDKMQKKKLKNEEAKCRQEIMNIMHDMEIRDVRCGAAACLSNKWCQKFAREEVYLIVYCLIGLTLGAYFTYSVSMISTIEKRFKLTSKMTGLMLSGNDVSQVLLSIFISYFGNYGNRAKVLGGSVLAASLSCFLSASPHLIYGSGKDVEYIIESLVTNSTPLLSTTTSVQKNKKDDFCYHPYQEDCSERPSETIGPVLILFIAQFCMGITIAAFYSIGMAYLDDNVDKKDTPVYYSVSMIIRLVGPVTGYFIGSRCLAIFINPQYKPNMSLRDPRWMGAWWLGYYLLSVVLFFLGFVILLFPRILPGTYYRKLKAIHKLECGENEVFSTSTDLKRYMTIAKENERHTKPSLAKLPEALKRLLTNKVYMGYLLNTVLALLALVGYWNFKPKYLEYQFRRSASEANLFTGLSGLVASVFGLGISGFIIKVFKPNGKFIAAYAIFLTLLGSAATLGLMTIGCPKIEVQSPLSWNDDLGACNVDCGCTDRYSPVCSEDGTTVFYSSCYAGCKEINSTSNPITYKDCECIKTRTNTSLEYQPVNGSEILENVNIVTSEIGKGSATQGYCTESCDAFSKYLVLTAFNSMIAATGRIGGTLLLIRSVDEEDKGLALGMLTVCLSLFSFIPAPILMGTIIDYSCIIWDNTCGKLGNCWLYDSDIFRILIHAVPSAILLLSLSGDIIVYIYCDDVKLYGEEDTVKTSKDTEKSVMALPELKEEKSPLYPLNGDTQIKTNNPD